jgi:predicted nucleotidyltransferase component of viral defense system
MPTYKQVIANARRASGLLLDAIVKDHILGYLLASIAGTPELGDRLAFKGGTALRKCWFPAYRYSEDLDFTVVAGAEVSEDHLLQRLDHAAKAAAEMVPDYGARYTFDVRTKVPREPHPFGQSNVRLVGRAPSGAPVTIKVEVTGDDEPIVLPLIDRPLLHSFPDEHLDATIRCYALEEIAAEKIRAGLQVRDRLDRFAERGKVGYAHRVRDIYDLWFLRTNDQVTVDWSAVSGILPAKARARGANWASADDFRDPRVERLYREQWIGRLQGFVDDLPTFDVAWDTYSALLDEVVAGSMPTDDTT